MPGENDRDLVLEGLAKLIADGAAASTKSWGIAQFKFQLPYLFGPTVWLTGKNWHKPNILPA